MSTKIKELEIFKENPFLDGVGYSQKKKTEILYDGKQAVIHSESGEVLEDHLSIARVRFVDADQFIKVYLTNLHVFFDLGKPAQRVCEFVLHQIGHRSMGRGEVLLSYSEYETFCTGRQGGTRQTFMRGVQELAAKISSQKVQPVTSGGSTQLSHSTATEHGLLPKFVEQK